MSLDQWHTWVRTVQCCSSCSVADLRPARSSTAPEVLAKRGYFATVDWWSLGIVAYELLFGKRPYRGKTNSSLTQSILKEQIKFPDNAEQIVSAEGLDCIKGVSARAVSALVGRLTLYARSCCNETSANDSAASKWVDSRLSSGIHGSKSTTGACWSEKRLRRRSSQT